MVAVRKPEYMRIADLEQIIENIFRKKTCDKGIQIDSATDGNIANLLEAVDSFNFGKEDFKKLTILSSKRQKDEKASSVMYDESSDEDCGFEISSPADHLVHQAEYVPVPRQVKPTHNEIPPHYFNQQGSQRPMFAQSQSQMQPHPLMQRYGVPSQASGSGRFPHVPRHVRHHNPRLPATARARKPEQSSGIPRHSYVKHEQQHQDESHYQQGTSMGQANPPMSSQDFPSLSKENIAKNPKKSKMGNGSQRSQTVANDNQEREINMEELKQKNPKVSENWMKSVLQKNLFEPSKTDMQRLLKQIEDKWYDESMKDKSQASTLIREYYSRSSHPYALVIHFIENCQDYKSGKTSSLCFHLMKEFLTWLKNTKIVNEKELLTEDIKLRALQATTRYNTALFPMAVKGFQLSQDRNEYMLPQIREFLEKKKYNEAAVVAGKLGLQDHFTVEEIALPLVLQDKVNVLETYATGNPKQQTMIVQMLDNLCDKDLIIDDVISKTNVPNPKREKLIKKTLSKLAARLMKLYDIPQDLCPNISKARGVGAIRYLLYRKFIEGKMGAGSWEELIQNAVGDSDYLKEQLVEQLMSYNELNEAAKWAQIFQLSDDVIPEVVAVKRRTMDQEGGEQQIEDSGENWDDECYSEAEIATHYYTLDLPEDRITVVDTKDLYMSCISTLAKKGTVIGVDAEWRPSFGSQVAKIALIQLATYDQVYLIDIRTLHRVLHEDDWQLMVSSIFCNPEVIKLGYGLDSDFKMFVKTFPFMEKTLAKMQRVVDLEKLAQKVLDKVVNLMPDTENGSDEDEDVSKEEDDDSGVNFKFRKVEERGLSELVRQCFGKALNKSEQMSDWERRPLRQPQILYAALDAYILLKVNEKLVKTAQEQNLKIDLEPPTSMRWMKQSRGDKKKAKAKGMKAKAKVSKQLPAHLTQPSPNYTRPPISPGEFRCVVDSMLQGLGKQLRSCGVDVYILDNADNHDKAIEVCQKENRIVLSSGTPFLRVLGIVGEQMCYNVQTPTARDQVVEVLQYFNITVKEEDIFSRCKLCNGNNYLKVPCETFKQNWLMTKHVASTDRHTLNLEPQYGIDWSTMTVADNNVPLQLDGVPEPMFDKIETFFCCGTCGKVFWEGSHFAKVCDQFSHVLDMSSPGKNIYNS